MKGAWTRDDVGGGVQAAREQRQQERGEGRGAVQRGGSDED